MQIMEATTEKNEYICRYYVQRKEWHEKLNDHTKARVEITVVS